ncbi:hypothetical protein DPMN_036746 [Dreissena polymorpha]|uniref:Uncharacterized protein n=1 Tax=Dreissena polymorpha TaxID=45954 RepID=A0A9D4RM63_DREPO|nr:hypothetical protein DPMN_036746 [Dreissena polymorpha]
MQRYAQTDKDTHRQTKTRTDNGQTVRNTDGYTDANGKTDARTNTWAHGHRDGRTDRETYRKTDRQTNRRYSRTNENKETRTDGHTDGYTDGRRNRKKARHIDRQTTDRRTTDTHTDEKKDRHRKKKHRKRDRRTDRRKYGRTDRRTHKPIDPIPSPKADSSDSSHPVGLKSPQESASSHPRVDNDPMSHTITYTHHTMAHLVIVDLQWLEVTRGHPGGDMNRLEVTLGWQESASSHPRVTSSHFRSTMTQ